MADGDNEFVERLLKQTAAAPSQPRRGQNYNYPSRLYMKTDGMVVSLQGDPQSRAYYQDKGFHLLGQSPTRGGDKSEERQYVEDEYPKLLREQREKAAIVNAIRRAGERYRDLALEDTFDDYSIDELREYLQQIKQDTGKDIRVILPKRAAAREAAAEAQLLAGVETSASQSIEGLQSILERSQGYDPTEQGRRRGRPGGTT